MTFWLEVLDVAGGVVFDSCNRDASLVSVVVISSSSLLNAKKIKKIIYNIYIYIYTAVGLFSAPKDLN